MRLGTRGALRACGATLALLALAGCVEQEGYAPYSGSVSNADVVGSWTSNCGAGLVVTANGKVSASHFPNTVMTKSSLAAESFTGAGTWALYHPSPDGGDPGLLVKVDNVLNTLYYTSVSGKLGFAFDLMDTEGNDEGYCIFSRSSGT